MNAEKTTLDDLGDAWDKIETEELPETPEAEHAVADEPDDNPEPTPAVETLRPEDSEPDHNEPEPVPADQPPTAPVADIDQPADSPALSAPKSWSAPAREMWGDIPEAARDYIQQREEEVSQGIQKYAQNARRAEQMDQVLAPHAQYLHMGGGAAQTINNLLQTGSLLQMGSPMQRAQVTAQLIQNFGVDIQTLDHLLAGEAPPEGAVQANHVQSAVQQAVAPYQQFMTEMQQREQQQNLAQQNEAGSEVERFAADPANEFYQDVKMDMADILDRAADQGHNLTMKEAYDKACRFNDAVWNTLEARRQRDSVAQKRNAASSISGTQSGPGDTSTPQSLRATIEAAVDNAERV